MAKRKSGAEKASESEASIENLPMVRGNVAREVVNAPTFVSLYANDAQIQTTPWDVRLIFGQLTTAATADSPKSLITLNGEVRMSPQLAKRVTMILMMQLQSYEKQFGPIPQPPQD